MIKKVDLKNRTCYVAVVVVTPFLTLSDPLFPFIIYVPLCPFMPLYAPLGFLGFGDLRERDYWGFWGLGT